MTVRGWILLRVFNVWSTIDVVYRMLARKVLSPINKCGKNEIRGYYNDLFRHF